MAHWNNSFYNTKNTEQPSMYSQNDEYYYQQYNIPAYIPTENYYPPTNQYPIQTNFSPPTAVWASQLEAAQINANSANSYDYQQNSNVHINQLQQPVSILEPTAVEFHPNQQSSIEHTSELNTTKSTGAIKKKINQYSTNSHQNESNHSKTLSKGNNISQHSTQYNLFKNTNNPRKYTSESKNQYYESKNTNKSYFRDKSNNFQGNNHSKQSFKHKNNENMGSNVFTTTSEASSLNSKDDKINQQQKNVNRYQNRYEQQRKSNYRDNYAANTYWNKNYTETNKNNDKFKENSNYFVNNYNKDNRNIKKSYNNKTNLNKNSKIEANRRVDSDNKGLNRCKNQNSITELKNSDVKMKSNKKQMQIVENFVTLREKLTEQARKGIIECLVCCERVQRDNAIWSCQNCYHILHLKCIEKWATSSKDAQGGWRCPACQHVTSDIPYDYYCYCLKIKNPVYELGDLPHSCGQMCGRKSKRTECSHRCTLLCHPGPCPDCAVFVSRKCGCGATTQTVQCSNTISLTCSSVCGKLLNCGVHYCERICHIGDCYTCKEIIIQVCFCGKKKQEVKCIRDNIENEKFSCDEVCGNLLKCGNHTCKKLCHNDACEECELSPEFVTTCYCGQTPLTDNQKRNSCLDPIPTCDKICGKKYKCGPPYDPHTCKVVCHSGDCPPCELFTLNRCRCGHMDREIPCVQLTGHPDDARCEKKCTKKRSCGRHKCNKFCCIDIDHECTLPCNRTLSCGKHKCEANCHRGRCLPCLQSSFEELYCECGANVIYPPVACGTRPPTCTNTCTRQHECDHLVMHTCHSEPECPPCNMLTSKWCFGKHELRKTIPCYQNSFSCGLPCGKDLPCNRHKCILKCHEGSCLSDDKHCNQPCAKPRTSCNHLCGVPCHDGPCPNTPCKEMVKVTCVCGHRSTMRTCNDQSREYQHILAPLLASKMKDVQLGNSVSIGDLTGSNLSKKEERLKTLECNDECKIIERNRRLAIGLQIRNPDLSQKLTPRYSEFMKQWAKKDPFFCQKVHDKLTELVQLSKQSKQKSRSYSFESMNRDKRHFIHEYCEHFGCESAAYDQEPNRNVVATASRDKAWLPSYSLLEVIQRESGQRKVPGPVLRNTTLKPVITSQTTSMRISNRNDDLNNLSTVLTPSSSSNINSNPPVKENEIDYFEHPPE